MRMLQVLGLGGTLGLSGLFLLAACANSANDCLRTGLCLMGELNSGPGGGGGTSDPTCIPSENLSPVGESCGVFVSSSMGDDNGEGTPGVPVKTLAKALELAQSSGKPVYACAEEFAESATVEAGTVLYGGLSCAGDWRYVGSKKKTTIAPPADALAQSQIALVLRGSEGTTTRIEDVSVIAPDANMPGGSSIGVLADGGSVELVRCEIAAGNGMAGAKPEIPSDPIGPTDPNDMLIRGMDGTVACMGNMSGNLGGAGTTNALCMASVGGDGGTGQVTQGDKGNDGQPLPSPNPSSKGVGGAGDDGSGSGCNAGFEGQIGLSGGSGVGAPSTSEGTLSSSGFVGADGAAGEDGAPGQGGGGGGGAKGKVGCNGASGGGGGAGGCGGKGGRGGQEGGASIALASVAASAMLIDVVLLAGNGGDGGDGGEGQDGATGGVGGLGGAGLSTLKACVGGKGGQGGFGGKGGGGRGGPSVGIAYTFTAPVIEGTQGSIMLGTPGKGGAGADMSGAGADGTKAEMLDLSKAN
jgi:hypothetical protein